MKYDKDFKELLSRLDPSDFDGHTEFNRLEPALRLEWLSHAGRFLFASKRELRITSFPPGEQDDQ